jgi:hypothetical protein
LWGGAGEADRKGQLMESEVDGIVHRAIV